MTHINYCETWQVNRLAFQHQRELTMGFQLADLKILSSSLQHALVNIIIEISKKITFEIINMKEFIHIKITDDRDRVCQGCSWGMIWTFIFIKHLLKFQPLIKQMSYGFNLPVYYLHQSWRWFTLLLMMYFTISFLLMPDDFVIKGRLFQWERGDIWSTIKL